MPLLASCQRGMHFVVVRPENFKREDALQFAQRQDRLPLRRVVAARDHVG